MIDATLEKPFFRRKPDGSIMYPTEAGFVTELGALDAIPDDDDWSSDEEQEEDEEHVSARGHEEGVESASGEHHAPDQDDAEEGYERDAHYIHAHNEDHHAHESSFVRAGPRIRVDFKVFERNIWPRIVNVRKVQTRNLSASSVFQEIQSFIKVRLCVYHGGMCVCACICVLMHERMRGNDAKSAAQHWTVLNTKVLNTKVLNTKVLNTQVLNTQVLNTKVLNTQVLNTEVLNTKVLNTKVLNTNTE
jgi:hypothetical protein